MDAAERDAHEDAAERDVHEATVEQLEETRKRFRKWFICCQSSRSRQPIRAETPERGCPPSKRGLTWRRTSHPVHTFADLLFPDLLTCSERVMSFWFAGVLGFFAHFHHLYQHSMSSPIGRKMETAKMLAADLRCEAQDLLTD